MSCIVPTVVAWASLASASPPAPASMLRRRHRRGRLSSNFLVTPHPRCRQLHPHPQARSPQPRGPRPPPASPPPPPHRPPCRGEAGTPREAPTPTPVAQQAQHATMDGCEQLYFFHAKRLINRWGVVAVLWKMRFSYFFQFSKHAMKVIFPAFEPPQNMLGK